MTVARVASSSLKRATEAFVLAAEASTLVVADVSGDVAPAVATWLASVAESLRALRLSQRSVISEISIMQRSRRESPGFEPAIQAWDLAERALIARTNSVRVVVRSSEQADRIAAAIHAEIDGGRVLLAEALSAARIESNVLELRLKPQGWKAVEVAINRRRLVAARSGEVAI
jgi:hypothetical protein